jgi:hypothetical protein
MTANHYKKKSRRNFVRSAIVGLGAIPLASLDTKASLKAPQDVRQTSPILVGGGGSVGIDFDSGWFTYDSVTKRFSNKDDALHKLWLVDKYGARQDITPKNEDCVVTINCGKSSGKTYYVTIYGKPLGIEFDTTHFQFGYPPEGVKKIYHHPKRKISKITVHDNVVPSDTEYEPPTKGKCSIIVVDKL